MDLPLVPIPTPITENDFTLHLLFHIILSLLTYLSVRPLCPTLLIMFLLHLCLPFILLDHTERLPSLLGYKIVCNHSTHSSNTCFPRSFALAHTLLLANVAAVQEPRSFSQANQHDEWRKAMQLELHELELNQTWDLTTLPKGKKAIGSRWIYKLKLLLDGKIDRYKARLVTKGYTQIEGIDYFDSFSPIAKTVTVRLFLAITSSHSWPISQLDVNNAFLHGHLNEEVYMHPPEGYLQAQSGQVCCLKRSLYGLKQASRQWNKEFSSKLKAYSFRQSQHAYCLFHRQTSTSFRALLVYVDDVLITGTSLDCIQDVKAYLDNLFTIKDLGFARYFLGLELARSSHCTYVMQCKYLRDILVDCKMHDAHSVPTPLSLGIRFDSTTGALLPSPDRYRRLIGHMLYLGFSRSNISFAVQQFKQFLQHPQEPH
ncbi:UNVERIFIED_CONTAM: Retrovirus-related Pol polyprotein from transposon RE1 [Sesamum radiatum]|uniref:Retrovirus-related Pol polyprotein from transposon RE1 n=1 Tax=Sesamum radiatum TaxID=300843 RepID=A0AAW2R062_SESRA